MILLFSDVQAWLFRGYKLTGTGTKPNEAVAEIPFPPSNTCVKKIQTKQRAQ